MTAPEESHKVLRRTSSNVSNASGYSLCQVCFEPFNVNICVPKLLPCGHSFCQDCITSLRFNCIYLCKCPTCRYAFPLRYDTNFPTNYSLLDLLAQLELSDMAKGTDGVVPQNEATVAAPRVKGNKPKSSKNPQSSSRISHLFSKISGKDKKGSSNYYKPGKAPFTSTPDMSADEDGPFGVDVSYVETESESEDTVPVPARDSKPVTVQYVSGAILDDSTTSPDYSSSSTSGIWGRIVMKKNHTSPKPETEQTTQPETGTVDQNSNVIGNAESKSRLILRKMRRVVILALKVLLAIVISFWSVVITKMLYGDLSSVKSNPSMLCSGVKAIDSWLPFSLAKMIGCDEAVGGLLGRLRHEAELVIIFLTAQFSFIALFWEHLTKTLSELWEEWLPSTLDNVEEALKDYYETVWASLSGFVENCIDLITQVFLVLKGFTIELYENLAHSLGIKVDDIVW